MTPWTVARQAPLSMGFSRQEHWRGSPCPSPGDLLDPGIKPRSPVLWADSLQSEPPGKPETERTKEGGGPGYFSWGGQGGPHGGGDLCRRPGGKKKNLEETVYSSVKF